VRALLSQHGGRLSQLEIASALGLPAEPIAGKLLKMGGEGLIEREWTVDEYTYSVKRQSA
jgi:DNA-binding Lrp family transcriptional regulator